ncbi:MAG: VWA domain-containing protein [Rubritalea sp.]|uniref:VWA domain-containing protein n=1 Tax=Rubritalea sp. TaxID=2109375 RepID=UPI003242B67F
MDESPYLKEESASVYGHDATIEAPQQGFAASKDVESSNQGFLNTQKTSQFLGNFDEGDSIAFVLDFSGSMDGIRVSILKKELIRSLKDLNSEVLYSVIIFSDQGWFLGNKKSWIKANTDNVNETVELLSSQHVGGGTEWSTGMNLAFSLNPSPEVIYFMTDGATNSDVVHEIDTITQQNQSKFSPARIHTTALVYEGMHQYLINLASKNGGCFTWVNDQGEATTKR